MLTINPMNQTNNYKQSFGTYQVPEKFIGETTHNVATEIAESPIPTLMLDHFTQLIGMLRKLTTDIEANCKKVFVTDPTTNRRYEISDMPPIEIQRGGCFKLIDIHRQEEEYIYVKPEDLPIGKNLFSLKELMKSGWDLPLIRKHIAALLIGDKFDQKLAQKAANGALENTNSQKIQEIQESLKSSIIS